MKFAIGSSCFGRIAAWRGVSTKVLAAALLVFSGSAVAQTVNQCDLNGDGVVDQNDVNLVLSGILTPASCTANIIGQGVCNVMVLQRVIDDIGKAASGCTLGNPHWVALSWTASSTPNVNYNVYRGTQSGGPYTLMNPTPVSTTSYNDTGVQLGVTYYYVVKAVDANNNLSAASNEASAIVPST